MTFHCLLINLLFYRSITEWSFGAGCGIQLVRFVDLMIVLLLISSYFCLNVSNAISKTKTASVHFVRVCSRSRGITTTSFLVVFLCLPQPMFLILSCWCYLLLFSNSLLKSFFVTNIKLETVHVVRYKLVEKNVEKIENWNCLLIS